MTYRIDVDRLMVASSLAALIEARARLARAELAALRDRLQTLSDALATTETDRSAFTALVDNRARLRDRVLRDALRAIGGAAHPAMSADETQLALEEQAAVSAALEERARRLTDDSVSLEATLESVAAKEDELRRLDARSQMLVSVNGELAVLRDLADESSRVTMTISELLQGVGATDAPAATWTWPLRGVITQRFGPSALGLEPPVTYLGVRFTHFHDAIDIAGSLGSVVTAPASGRIVFVGHLPDGAMVVVLQHDDGFVSMAAHLDDTFAPPPVATGQRVARGQVIGYVGMTGLTTGPHLHFAVHFNGQPVDPLGVLPPSQSLP
ncbi:MAG: M23 family metallopeptidase [Chloroflexi bacterium]|nr:MAG: M23 family metallopeptidase [Chloroflexota bacterium]